MSNTNLNIDVNSDIIQQSIIHKNLRQEIILTNTDKVKLLLIKHNEIVKRKIDWLAPFSIFITLSATLLTAEFKDTVLGLDSSIWKSLFLLCCFGSLGLTIYYGIIAIKYYKKGTIEEFIANLKIEEAN